MSNSDKETKVVKVKNDDVKNTITYNDKLKLSLYKLYKSNTGDITLVLQNEKILIHSFVLTLCSFFERVLSTSMKEQETKLIDLSTYDSQSIKYMCEFLYTSTIDFSTTLLKTQVSKAEEITKLILLADTFMFSELVIYLNGEIKKILIDVELEEKTFTTIVNSLYMKKNMESVDINKICQEYFDKYIYKCYVNIPREFTYNKMNDLINLHVCYDSIKPGTRYEKIYRDEGDTYYHCCQHFHIENMKRQYLKKNDGDSQFFDIENNKKYVKTHCFTYVNLNNINLTHSDIPQDKIDELSTSQCCLHKNKGNKNFYEDQPYNDMNARYLSLVIKYLNNINDEAKLIIFDMLLKKKLQIVKTQLIIEGDL